MSGLAVAAATWRLARQGSAEVVVPAWDPAVGEGLGRAERHVEERERCRLVMVAQTAANPMRWDCQGWRR